MTLPGTVLPSISTPPNTPLPPEVNAALKKVRDSNGRCMIAIFTTDEEGEVTLDSWRGKNWSKGAWLTAYGLLAQDMLAQNTPIPVPESALSNEPKSDDQ